MQECEEPSPPCEFSWYATQWSQCSSKCSDMMGLQTRLEDVDENENVNKDDDGVGMVVVDVVVWAQFYLI